VGGFPAVVPSIVGRAWITSFNQLDPTDPFSARIRRRAGMGAGTLTTTSTDQRWDSPT
jgi:proline racemase